MTRLVHFFRSVAAAVCLLAGAPPGAANEPVTQPLTPVQTIDFDDFDSPAGIAIDPVNRLLYLAQDATISSIRIFSLATPTEPAALLHTVILQAGDQFAATLIVDPHRNALYAVCFSSPGRIIKFRTTGPGAPPTRLGHLDLLPGERFLIGAAFDEAANTAYFGGADVPGLVAKVHLGDGDALPTRVGVLTLLAGEEDLRGVGAISPSRGKLWAIPNNNPATVVQINLGAPGAPPTRESAITVPFLGPFFPVEFDPLHERIYFGNDDSPGRVVKLDVSGPGPVLIEAATMPVGLEKLRSAALSQHTGILYLANNSTPPDLVRVADGGRFGGPARTDDQAVAQSSGGFNALAYDALHGFLYFGTNDATIPDKRRLAIFRQNFAAGADLTGTIGALKVSGKPGKFRVKARLTESNIGSADAGLHLVRFFLSDDSVLDAHDTQIAADRVVKSVKTVKSRSVPLNSSVLAGSPSGKFIIAQIDRNNLTNDVNPGNNVIVSAPLP